MNKNWNNTDKISLALCQEDVQILVGSIFGGKVRDI